MRVSCASEYCCQDVFAENSVVSPAAEFKVMICPSGLCVMWVFNMFLEGNEGNRVKAENKILNLFHATTMSRRPAK